VLAWTDAFLSPAPSADPALRREMLAHFTPAEIVELSAGLALFMGFSKIALALGGVPDELPLNVQPTPDEPAPTSGG
jgi:alkylhydroperoxidase family enzyme